MNSSLYLLKYVLETFTFSWWRISVRAGVVTGRLLLNNILTLFVVSIVSGRKKIIYESQSKLTSWTETNPAKFRSLGNQEDHGQNHRHCHTNVSTLLLNNNTADQCRQINGEEVLSRSLHWENCLHFVYAPRCVSFFTHPTALMHLKKRILRKCIQLHYIFLAPTRMGSHWELL